MTFLELVGEVHRESGSGGTAPTSFDNLRGENLRLKNWVAKAYRDIQEKYVDWKFRWAQGTIDLSAGTAIYDPLPSGSLSLSPDKSIAEYDRDTFRLNGEQLAVVNYHAIKDEPLATTAGYPYRVVILPDDTLRFDPPPDQDYVVTFDYWVTPDVMGATTDEPIIPKRFHDVIVAKALMYYASYENAPEILQQAQLMMAELMPKLEADQLPGDRYMQQKAEGNEMVIEVE